MGVRLGVQLAFPVVSSSALESSAIESPLRLALGVLVAARALAGAADGH